MNEEGGGALTLLKVSLAGAVFVATRVCLPPQNFCRDKIMFVATKYFGRDKYLSRQARVCRYKSFVATTIFLSRQTHVCPRQ